MSKYSDVYLVPMREENVAAYKKMATSVGKVFMKHGAVRYREYIASDLAAEGVVSFTGLLELKPGETAIFAAVEFKSEAHRNSVMKKIFADPAMIPPDGDPLFDCTRMVYGGFKILVDL
jgi:uncharacterized protein YbaA (DUF1428 family)